MIKSLLNADEEPSPKNEETAAKTFTNLSLNEVPTENKAAETPLNTQPEAKIEEKTADETGAEKENSPNNFEIPEDAKFFTKSETLDDSLEKISLMSEEELEKLLEEEEKNYKNLTDTEFVSTHSEEKTELESLLNSAPVLTNATEEKPKTDENPTISYHYQSETPDETIHKSGLAYSAAMVLLASVVFMMLLGWFADLILGSSPWGIVGGIIIGGIIGFIQFFKIASSIFKK